MLRFIRLAFAVLNLSFSAKYFGVSLERDVWLLALNAIIVFDGAIWGPINETFRAKFLFIKAAEGEAEALRKTKSLFFFTNAISIILVCVIMIFPTTVANLLAPKYTGSKLNDLILMIRVLAPIFLLTQINKLLNSVLNAYGSFIMPEVVGIISQLSTTVLLVTLASSIGIFSLAISYYFGLIVLLSLLFLKLSSLKVGLFMNWQRSDLTAFKVFLIYSLPFFLPYLIGQISQVIEKSLASSFTGGVSIVDYSRKFSDIPMEVLVGILVSMLVPILSTLYAANKREQFVDEFKRMYQFGFMIVIIIIAMLSVCPEAFVNILYGDGDITKSELHRISNMTRFYGFATLPVYMYSVFGAALLSANRGSRYALYGSLAQLIMISLNLTFYERIGVYVFPISLLLSHLFSAVLLSQQFPVKNSFLGFVTLKYVTLLSVIVGLMMVVKDLVCTGNEFICIALNLMLLLSLMVSAFFLFKFEERNLIVNIYRKIKSL